MGMGRVVLILHYKIQTSHRMPCEDVQTQILSLVLESLFFQGRVILQHLEYFERIHIIKIIKRTISLVHLQLTKT